jgi:hypothetical protein
VQAEMTLRWRTFEGCGDKSNRRKPALQAKEQEFFPGRARVLQNFVILIRIH